MLLESDWAETKPWLYIDKYTFAFRDVCTNKLIWCVNSNHGAHYCTTYLEIDPDSCYGDADANIFDVRPDAADTEQNTLQVEEGLSKIDPYFEKLAKGMRAWIAAWDELNGSGETGEVSNGQKWAEVRRRTSSAFTLHTAWDSILG